MSDQLLDKYLEYASTEEALAVLFVKKHLPQAEGSWVDVVDCRRYEMSSDPLHFRFVEGDLFERRLRPWYPSKSAYFVDGEFREHDYYLMARAVTWQTAHDDMRQQRSEGVEATRFRITGVSYDKNRSSNSYFRDDAPPEIKALAENLHGRTSPLWDRAAPYVNKPEFVYEIRQVRITKRGA